LLLYNSALILNSALWDVLSDEAAASAATADNNNNPSSDYDDPWQEHCDALRTYLQHVTSLYSKRCRTVWLLPTAVHIHRVYLADEQLETRAPHKIDRCRYMSASRTRQLYDRQVAICSELQIPTMDLFQATYSCADWTLPGDGRHYRPELNRKMLGWFYH